MQEALKNPHYKKIWERVILNRHPEAKSLEEALEDEIYEDYCLFFNIQQKMYDITMSKNILAKNIKAGREHCYPYQEEDEAFGWQYGEDFKIIGRQINLDDILILCKNVDIKKYAIVEKTNIISLYQMGLEKYFDWKLTKPLHEQTPQTWENISKLID